ncbi:hypothetical protein GCM10009626_07290 [Brachybacterium sacelli]
MNAVAQVVRAQSHSKIGALLRRDGPCDGAGTAAVGRGRRGCCHEGGGEDAGEEE